jgi:hypothetical protein
MLNDIGGILPYSRLGTQENILAYRFMSEPLAVNDLTVVKNDPIETEEVNNNIPESKMEKEKPEHHSVIALVLHVRFVE